MRPPGGVSFAADQMNHRTSAANVSRQQHENGRNHFVHQKQSKNGKTNGCDKKTAEGNSHFANGSEFVQPNGRGRRETIVHLQQKGCACCPYGFHIDLGFVKFAEDVAAGKEQIQNWSSPEKKRTRLLLNSPSSSDRTMLDVSQTSDRGNTANDDNGIGIVSSLLNEPSSFSKCVEEEDELPELLHNFSGPHQILPQIRVNQPKHRHTQQNGSSRHGDHQNGMPMSILKNSCGTHWAAEGTASAEGFGRATPTEQRCHQQKSTQIYRSQPQQHQSRFYQQQPTGGGRLAMPSSSSAPTPPIGRRRFSLSMASTTPVDAQQNVPMPSLRLTNIGSPLRTSTPRIANEETQQIFSLHQQRPSSAYHPPTSAIIGDRRDFVPPSHRQKLDEMANANGANSAPTSPEPRNYQTAIAQSMAQLRQNSAIARPNGALSSVPVVHCSLLSSLSVPARNVFCSANNIAIPSLAHFRHPTTTAQQRPRQFLELGGGQRRRMLSPEPNQMPILGPPAESSLLRKSNMQSRAFFHAANNGGGGLAAVGRVPYRSRQCITPTPSSAWDLGDFASVRRHRVDALSGTDSVGSFPSASVPSVSFPPSAQFVRSLSPPPSVLLPSTSSSHRQMTESFIAHSPPLAHSNAAHPFPQKTFAQSTRNIGTQTLFGPSKKEIAIGTDFCSNWPPKKAVKETGTSPAECAFSLDAHSPPFAVPSVSIGVDTYDLSHEIKSVPPLPPPKPTGPKIEEEMQRRRDREQRRAKFGNLSAEFQYCLGHEPEHKPGEQPQFMGTEYGQSERNREKKRNTIDFGVDAFCPNEEKVVEKHSLGTSTTDLEEKIAKKEGENAKKMENANVQTEEQKAAKNEKGIGTETKGTRTTEMQTEETEAEKRTNTEAEEAKQNVAQGTQTDESIEWVEAEISRRLAQAATERREKRKRNSVERSTETEEKEAPDQFIMITCNKCEQRSSVAGDELFEKIVVPPEDNANEMEQMPKSGGHADEEEQYHGEKRRDEDGQKQKGGEEEREREEEEEEIIGEEMLESFAVEGNFRAEMETILEELEEELEKEEHGKEAKMEGGEGQSEEKEKSESVQKWQRKMEQQQQPQQLPQNICPPIVSCDEESALAERAGEEKMAEGAEEEQMAMGRESMELDRISIETDAQTVICAEGADFRPESSVSSDSTDERANSALAASRTEALRKLLTEPQRYAQPFQRDASSYRSYRTEKGKANDLEYITERHKSDTMREAEPTTAGEGRKALKEAIALKKTTPQNASSPTSTQTLFSISHIPEPIPARIPRPKFAKYSPNAEQAETADEQAEASDRLTPLRSEMRALASSLWASSASVSPSSSACSSPRIGRALILRPQQKDDGEEDNEDGEGRRVAKNRGQAEGEAEDMDTTHSALVVMEDGSSTSSEGARTYEMSDDERAEFELSAPLRDALEKIDAHLAGGTNGNTKKEQTETEWAYKYCQHEWMKLTIKKNADADLVEQFIDALETFSNRLMEKVVNMTDQNGNSALHYAVSNENFDVVSVLLDSKVCRVDEMNKAGYSALMLGALCELRNETECAIVQRLFQMGNVNAKAMKHSQTALMLAASHGRVETTSLLLSCGADVNIQDVDGSTALMCAAEHGQREIVKILLKRSNIDASLTDCDNQTALSIAVENQHRDIGVLIYAHLNFSRLESNEQSGVSI